MVGRYTLMWLLFKILFRDVVGAQVYGVFNRGSGYVIEL